MSTDLTREQIAERRRENRAALEEAVATIAFLPTEGLPEDVIAAHKQGVATWIDYLAATAPGKVPED